MHTWVKHSLNVGALTAGALLASGAAAHASPTMSSTDNTGALNGTQVALPIQAPIDLCGNAVAVAGSALAGCEGGSAASLNPEWGFDHYRAETGPAMSTSGNTGIGNGTQVAAPIQAPINVCGNAIAVLGSATAGCEGGSDATIGKPHKPGKPGGGYDKHQHKPSYGYTHDADYTAEDAHATEGAEAAGAPSAEAVAQVPAAQVVATNEPEATMVTSGNVGVLNGTQALVPVQVPIDVCGNAIAVLGSATAGCEGGASAHLG